MLKGVKRLVNSGSFQLLKSKYTFGSFFLLTLGQRLQKYLTNTKRHFSERFLENPELVCPV